MQYKCIYCLQDWRRNIHIVTHTQQHDWLSTTWQRFMRGPDGHRTDRRTKSRCTPVRSESHTSWGMRSFQAAHSQTAGPATACEEHCASWRLSGSGLEPWCSWGPSAGFHTWTVSCPHPTGGPPYASDQRLCSNPPSSSSLWHWQPSVASWQSHISLGSWSLVLRTQIQSQSSWVDETSWFLVEESNWRMSPDQTDSDTSQQDCQRSFQFQLQGSAEVPSVLQPGRCPSCAESPEYWTAWRVQGVCDPGDSEGAAFIRQSRWTGGSRWSPCPQPPHL